MFDIVLALEIWGQKYQIQDQLNLGRCVKEQQLQVQGSLVLMVDLESHDGQKSNPWVGDRDLFWRGRRGEYRSHQAARVETDCDRSVHGQNFTSHPQASSCRSEPGEEYCLM